MTRGAAPPRSALEVERKYDVTPSTAVPDLADVPGVAAVEQPREHLLDAVYYDTDDLRLRRAGITLRHRTGGTDAGWTLKLPAGSDREEVTVDAGPEAVPEALSSLVRARVRDRELTPVAVLRTRRVVQRLLGAGGEPLAEVADDRVDGRSLLHGEGRADGEGRPAAGSLQWREWEVELLTGGRPLLGAVQSRLLAAGATPSTSASKLGRVLPRPQPITGSPPWWSSEARRPGRETAGGAVQAHLAEQVAEVVARDAETRRDVPDALHRMRVATRRLRSALATFRPLLDRERTDPLRDELRWLAGVLGDARDAEVMHARLRSLVADEPGDLVLGRVQDRVDTLMTRRYRDAHEQVVAALDGDRYLRLLDELDDLVSGPPFLPAAGGAAVDVLPALVRRTWKGLDRAMEVAEQAPRGPHQDELLHEVRKQAKRARYAAESVRPVFGGPARRYAKAVAALQESLGDFQDGVVTREVLRELGALGHRSGENGFTFGRLHALEQVRAEAAVRRFPDARAAVSRRRLRRWLDR